MSRILAPLLLAASLLCFPRTAGAYSARHLERLSLRALHHLCETNPKARSLGQDAVAVLVFPEVVKAGFLVAAQRGDGVLFRDGRVAGYYNITSAGYGLQAGVQKLSYALFFLDEHSLKYLRKSEGFDLGSAPGLVVANEGFSGSLSVASVQRGIAAFVWGQKGLMGGLGLQGTKITRYVPSQ